MQALDEIDPGVTLLVGENGSGKSTLVEAIAVAAGFNTEGGSRNVVFARAIRRPSCTDTCGSCGRRGARPRAYSLRAESFFDVASQVEELGPEIARAYGDRSLHEQPSSRRCTTSWRPVASAWWGRTRRCSWPTRVRRPLELDDDGITEVAYDDLAHVRLYRSLLDAPERFLRQLVAD